MLELSANPAQPRSRGALSPCGASEAMVHVPHPAAMACSEPRAAGLAWLQPSLLSLVCATGRINSADFHMATSFSNMLTERRLPKSSLSP